MTDLVINLNETARYETSHLGGKAVGLGKLIQEGFPVPDGFVLTSESLKQALSKSGYADKLSHLVEDLERTSTDSSEFSNLVDEVRKTLLSVNISAELFDLIKKQFSRIVQDSKSPAVAVRSSAAVEDSSSASAAGQFSTFLNIRNEEALGRAINECWASFYTDRSIRYRKRKVIALWPPEMAVIVQTQVNADVSGIVFTAHPQRGGDWLAVESSWGLGEPIVGGRITPDLFEINKKTGQVEEKIGSKRIKVIIKGEDMVEVETDASERSQLSLKTETLSLLTDLCLRVEASLSGPQDIEFAISHDVIYLLQARPITTLA